jgi:hypothetical protein
MQLITNGFLAWLLTATFSLQPTSLDSEFTRLEDRWNAAHRDADANSLAALWADDLEVVVPRMPPMTKGESLAFARTGRMKFDWRFTKVDARQNGSWRVVSFHASDSPPSQ